MDPQTILELIKGLLTTGKLRDAGHLCIIGILGTAGIFDRYFEAFHSIFSFHRVQGIAARAGGRFYQPYVFYTLIEPVCG